MYDTNYFNEGIFDTDYQMIASIIVEKYHPKTIAEFGCGNGYLTRSLNKIGVAVFAVDGFSSPQFESPTIEFKKVNLNSDFEIESVFNKKIFDLAICMEVAEHLDESSSDFLIKHLTESAPIVVFSAGIPNQGGHGHINCKPREFWFKIFLKYGYTVQDTLRGEFRKHESIADWYKYNSLVFIRNESLLNQNQLELLESLIASESASTSALFQKGNEAAIDKAQLNYLPVRIYLTVRHLLKSIIRKK